MDGADGLPRDVVSAVDGAPRTPTGSEQSKSGRNNDGHLARRSSTCIGGEPDPSFDEDLLPSRWWMAATAFPMAAGTLGPVASAFSICALVRPWRQAIGVGQTIETASFILDPVWLTAINAVQLAMALVANLFLLLNMARRIRFAVAQPVTMVGWYFSSLALVALTATAAGPLQHERLPHEGAVVWSQAFYYAVYAAVLYMVVASLMLATFVGAWTGHYPKDFQLTNSQRTLMLQTILFLVYLLVGALVFSNLEGWPYLDAVYWADVTLFTVGFGDLAAATPAGRALLFPYALVGIISLGLVIGSIRSLALERGRHRINARMTEKNRRRFLRTLERKGKADILQPVHDDDGLTEFQRREKEFNIMRRIQLKSASHRRWIAMATSGSIWIALWLVGAWVFQVCEHPYQGWSYFDGFYLSFVSLTTIGYGDVTPVSNAGRSFFVFWSLLALPTMTILISNAGDTIVKAVSDATLALGRITILPGERGLKRDLKEIIRGLTFGAIFEDVDIEDVPPGLLGAAQQTEDDRAAERADDADDARDAQDAQDAVDEAEARRPTSASDTSSQPGRANVSRAHTDLPTALPTALPRTRPEYHCVLIDEIARVIAHLRHTPPRKYTFHEWAWYLRLIGEDEHDAGQHRRAHIKPKTAQDAANDQWSWVGARSPLMSSQEEAEWILDKLTRRLQTELGRARDADRTRRGQTESCS